MSAVFTLVIACLGLSGSVQDPTTAPKLADLAWLEGSWIGTTEDKRVEAVYSSPAGGMIVAATKEFVGDRLAMFDFEHISVRDGKLALVPYPFGKRSVSFELESLDKKARKAVFANVAHDFPKRFVYHAPEPDHLVITLEGEMGGETMQATYDLRRKKAE